MWEILQFEGVSAQKSHIRFEFFYQQLQLPQPRMMGSFSRGYSCRKPTKTTHPAGSDILSRLPPRSAALTHRYDVCFLNASPRSFSSRLSCSMSGRLLNVSLQQPTAASSEPAPDSESPPSAPREARRPFKPAAAAAAGLVAAWGSMLWSLLA